MDRCSGLFAGAAKAIPYIKDGFLYLVLGALKLVIAIRHAKANVTAAFDAIGDAIDTCMPLIVGLGAAFVVYGANVAASALPAMIAFAAEGIAGAIAAMPGLIAAAISGAAAFGAMAVAVLAATWPFIAVAAVAAAVYEVFTHWDKIKALVVGAFNSVKAWLASFSLRDVAMAIVLGLIGALAMLIPGAKTAIVNFISSLVSGIASGAGAVVDAVKSMASGAVSGLLGALGIHSPSRVAKMAAGNVTSTFADETEAGGAKVQASVSKAYSVKMPKAGGAKKGGSGGDKPSIAFNNCTFGSGPDDVEIHVLAAIEKWSSGALA